jgi:hypothetical protein
MSGSTPNAHWHFDYLIGVKARLEPRREQKIHDDPTWWDFVNIRFCLLLLEHRT